MILTILWTIIKVLLMLCAIVFLVNILAILIAEPYKKQKRDEAYNKFINELIEKAKEIEIEENKTKKTTKKSTKKEG